MSQNKNKNRYRDWNRFSDLLRSFLNNEITVYHKYNGKLYGDQKHLKRYYPETWRISEQENIKWIITAGGISIIKVIVPEEKVSWIIQNGFKKEIIKYKQRTRFYIVFKKDKNTPGLIDVLGQYHTEEKTSKYLLFKLGSSQELFEYLKDVLVTLSCFATSEKAASCKNPSKIYHLHTPEYNSPRQEQSGIVVCKTRIGLHQLNLN